MYVNGRRLLWELRTYFTPSNALCVLHEDEVLQC